MKYAAMVSCLLTLVGFSIDVSAADATYQLHVATDGNDHWSGRLSTGNAAKTDGPLATLGRARDILRALHESGGEIKGHVEVIVHEGTYQIKRPLDLVQKDSGTKEAPVMYRAAPGQTVRLLGGIVLDKWQAVTDPDVAARIDQVARNHVRQVDLKKAGVADFGSPSGGGLELFFNGKPMTLSRWPNKGFSRIVEVLGKTERNVRGTKGCAEGIFQYGGDRPRRWLDEKDGWVHGYWFWDWADQRHPIKSIDPKRRTIEVRPPYHNYGYRKGQWFYAFNLLSEIDEPGEWYLDREQGVLYFWPPSPIEQAEVIVSVTPTLLTMKNVSYVGLRGFTIEGFRGTALTISGGENNRVLGCTIRNIGDWAVKVSGGKRHGVVGCDMYQMGGGGVSVGGGVRATLEPAAHFVLNNHIHHYARVKRMYQPAITLHGVGNRAAHNLIEHAPHMAIGFGGNNHLIELNEINDVCFESNDAGAIYSGRNWTMRGTVIRYNYLHDINGFEGRGCVGVYLDDMFCGTEISSNVFYRVTRAAFIGGGRDCVVKNNLFVDCKPALHIDARALGWAKGHALAWIKEAEKKGTLQGIPYTRPPYSIQYPKLVNILNDSPQAPKGNVVQQNVSVGGKWDEVYKAAREYVVLKNNCVDTDPRFVYPDRLRSGQHPAAVDFALKPDSPAWAIGFQKLPLDQIGLYHDAYRASWPVD